MVELTEGARFGRYVLKRRLEGEGDLIRRFVAEQAGMGRDVELRALTVAADEPSGLVTRFLHETKLLAGVEHDGIIPVLDCGVAEGTPYFTTPVRQSITLAAYVERCGGTLPDDEVVRCGELLAEALQYLHDQKMLHRGLTTTTVRFDLDRNSPYIAECAVMRDLKLQLTAQGVPQLRDFVPTPEKARGQPMDERTDVFLLCALLYELMTGGPPPAVLDAEGRFAPVPLPSLDMSGLAAVIVRGLSSEPGDRPSSARALSEELGGLAARHKVRLFVREAKPRSRPALAVTARVATLPKPAKLAVPPWAGPAAAGFFLALLVLGAFVHATRSQEGDGGPSPGPPLPAQTATAGGSFEAAAGRELARLADEVTAASTDGRTFTGRIDTFRRWLAAAPATSRPRDVTYVDVVRLRHHFLSTGDLADLKQLDDWIARSAAPAGTTAP